MGKIDNLNAAKELNQIKIQNAVDEGIAKKYAEVELAKQPMGYGLTRGELAEILAVPVTDVGDVPDEALYNIAAQKQASMKNMIAENRAYHANKPVGGPPQRPSQADANFYEQDGVDIMKMYDKGMKEYQMQKAVADKYEAGIDPVEASKWQNYGLGSKFAGQVGIE